VGGVRWGWRAARAHAPPFLKARQLSGPRSTSAAPWGATEKKKSAGWPAQPPAPDGAKRAGVGPDAPLSPPAARCAVRRASRGVWVVRDLPAGRRPPRHRLAMGYAAGGRPTDRVWRRAAVHHRPTRRPVLGRKRLSTRRRRAVGHGGGSREMSAPPRCIARAPLSDRPGGEPTGRRTNQMQTGSVCGRATHRAAWCRLHRATTGSVHAAADRTVAGAQAPGGRCAPSTATEVLRGSPKISTKRGRTARRRGEAGAAVSGPWDAVAARVQLLRSAAGACDWPGRCVSHPSRQGQTVLWEAGRPAWPSSGGKSEPSTTTTQRLQSAVNL